MGTIIAVAAHSDPNYDYYLIKVTVNKPVILEEDEVDDYGCPIVSGSRVLKRNCFSQENLLDMTYRLEDGKVAVVHVKSVRCICFELEETNKKSGKKKIYKLSLEQHEEIMANL